MTNLDHYRQAVELSLDCVLELDFSRCITSVNAAGCRILRATAPEELIGKPWESLWTPSTLDCARLALDRVFGGDATQFSGTAQAIDGGELQWYVTAIPARDGKRSIDSVIVVCRDLTERIHFETALEAVNLALTERLGLAKTASAAAQRREATLRTSRRGRRSWPSASHSKLRKPRRSGRWSPASRTTSIICFRRPSLG
jgi:PAS domain S-box-containing protein